MSPLVLSGDRENPTFLAAVAGIPCRLDKLAPRTTFSRTLCALHCFSVEIERDLFREKLFFLPKKGFSVVRTCVSYPHFILNFRDFIPCFLLKKNPMALDLSFFSGLAEPPRKVKNKKQQKEGVQSRLPINFAPSTNLKNLLMPEGTDRQRRLWAVEETHLMKEIHLSES